MGLLIFLVIMWLIAGILSFYMQRFTDGDEAVPMGFAGCMLMGVIGFLLILMQILRTRS